ncbi:MAG: DNA repair protein RecN [Firmicutes bacterium]|nr:DNA repair protein RecN [Bacillota bacterium]
MLRELHIQNFALIDDLALELQPGLNVLTGETGAGKSIVIGAIGLLLGERAFAEHIRDGKERALIEGVFKLCGKASAIKEFLDDAALDSEDELVITRELSRSGRNICRVNGRIFPVSFLKELGQKLFDLHGQHQPQSLLSVENHLEMLDAFGGKALLALRSEVEKLHDKRFEILKKLQTIGCDPQERARRREILEYQIQEIEGLSPTEEEEEKLLRKRKILSNAEQLYNTAFGVYRGIYSGDEQPSLIDSLQYFCAELKKVKNYDQALESPSNLLEEANTLLTEAAYELRNYTDNLEFDPQELEKIEERLSCLQDLKRKYGGTVTEVLEFLAAAKKELSFLIESEENLEALNHELIRVEKEYTAAAERLSASRKGVGQELEKLLSFNFKALALSEARFKVGFEADDGFSPHGRDRVEFLFSANKGEPLKPLTKIISGGEMSRVMLALKSILARQDSIPTLIFDEIDTGIGGTTIRTVAEKLANLSVDHQVICVTHSPQIAAMADHHILLYKEVSGGRTLTRARLLSFTEQKKEIARMLDGNKLTDLSMEHAANLLEQGKNYKKKIKTNST